MPTPNMPPNPATRTVNKFMGILTIGNKFTIKRNTSPSIILNAMLRLAFPNFKSIFIPNIPRVIINVPITI